MKLHKYIPLKPSQLVLIGDQFLIIFGLASALFANYRLLAIKEFPLNTIFYRMLFQLALGLTAWALFGINKKVIRFFNSKDFLALTGIIFLIHFFNMVIGWMMPVKYQLRAEIFIFSFLITSFYIITSRFIISFLYFHFRRSSSSITARKLLIYGAGKQGLFLKDSITNSYSEEYLLCAFIDDDRYRIGRSIDGLKVYNATKDLASLVEKFKITDIILSSNLITPEKKSALLEATLAFNIRVREFAGANAVFKKFNMEKLSSLDINDLMNREAIKLYGEHVATNLKNKTVLVTGAAGSIGSEIVRKLSEHGVATIICVDFSESALYDLEQELLPKYPAIGYKFILADIKSREQMPIVFMKHVPSVVYHAAAYKHVPMMELYPWQAIQTNVIGTWNIAQLAIQHKAEKFVLVSSDKAVNPTSVMGATKRLAEMLIQSLSCRNTNTSFVITRFGNVLGSNGSVVPLFKKQIRNGGPVTITHPDITRYFMTIAEACQLVLEASVMAKGGEIFVFDMGRPVKILDMAINMIRLAGFMPGEDIRIEFTGLRPGEKLYEELFSDKEKLSETYHEKIMISKENNHEIPHAEAIISRIQSFDNLFEADLLKKVIHEFIPEYKPETGAGDYLKIKNESTVTNPFSISNIATVK